MHSLTERDNLTLEEQIMSMRKMYALTNNKELYL